MRPRVRNRTRRVIHHHAHGYDLKPQPWTSAWIFRTLKKGAEHSTKALLTIEGSMLWSTKGQLGDHQSGQRAHIAHMSWGDRGE